MTKWLLGTVLALSLAGCATNHLPTADQQLTTALASEPVVITQQESDGASSMFNPSGTITMTSSADYLYPSGGWHLKPGAPLLSKMVRRFATFSTPPSR
jgi:hypothetical protein